MYEMWYILPTYTYLENKYLVWLILVFLYQTKSAYRLLYYNEI